VSKFLNIAFFLILFLAWSCSNLDQPSDLGRKIVEQKSQDSMRSGVYNTITLAQAAETYGSVNDSLSGLHIYTDSLQNGGARVSKWAIGNWKNEETVLRLSYFVEKSDSSSRLHRILYDLARDTTINRSSIKANLVWTNLTRYNSYDEVGVEVGMLKYSKDSVQIKNDKEFFPLNFLAVNPKNLNNSVPLTIESYLMKGKWPKVASEPDSFVIDSTIVRRYDVDWTNFVDTIKIDSTFFIDKDSLKHTVTYLTKRTQKEHKLWRTDTVISWKHFIDPSFYDSTLNGANGTITLYKTKDGQVKQVGSITHKSKIVKDDTTGYGGSVYDTLIFNILDTMVYRTDRSVKISKPGAVDWDSVIFTKKFVNARDAATGKVIPDTLLQSGISYILPLDKVPDSRGLRATGGKENLGDFMFTSLRPEEFKQFKDTLSIYLRIDKNSTHNNNVLHVSSPLIRISYKKKSDSTKTYAKDVSFSEKSIIAFSSDTLKNTTPVISGGLQRFAEIDLNLRDFFDIVQEEEFLSVGLADLTLFLDKAKTDFPLQYGDSILVNAIITTKPMNPREIFALPRATRTNYAYIKRDSLTAKIPIEATLVDYIHRNKIYDESVPLPQKAYLYLWFDDWTVGRIFFSPQSPVYLTYILQTRKGGGL